MTSSEKKAYYFKLRSETKKKNVYSNNKWFKKSNIPQMVKKIAKKVSKSVRALYDIYALPGLLVFLQVLEPWW